MNSNRKYRGKDVDMLTASSIIVNNAIANQQFLTGRRPVWSPPYFDNLKIRIDNALVYTGQDTAAEQRRYTQIVLQIQTNALDDLLDVKIQIDEDFKSDGVRRDEILKTLGYKTYYKPARAKDQEALVQMLYRFKQNLTQELINEITAKGTPHETLARIVSYADTLNKANISQEGVKGSKKTVSAETVAEFNAIYDSVISVAKIARNFYRGNPAMQDAFSYTKLIAKLNAAPKPKKE